MDPDKKKVSVSYEEFTLLQSYIEETCGVKLGDEKGYLIESRLESLLSETGCNTFFDLYLKAKSQPKLGLKDKIIDAMTTNETYWFRDQHPYKVLGETIFPEYVKSIKKGKRHSIRVWSAACSTGQEPYSIAITFLEFLRKVTGIDPSVLKITATDISGYTTTLAIKGKYDSFNMSRGISEDYKTRYFEFDGKTYSIAAKIKKLVKFKQFNLQNDFEPLGRFDIVFCRNVAIYFSKPSKVQLYGKIAKLLLNPGILFIGASETVREYSHDFVKKQHGKSVYYTSKKKR